MRPITIAIDGHSSCGKSTLAKALAKLLGYAYVDSGAMYRAVTLYLLERRILCSDLPAVVAALPQIHIHFEYLPSGNRTFLNGRDVEDEIRQMRVSENVSLVAAIPEVRRALVRKQQALGQHKAIVMDGRDIGTVVFPEAALKIFLTASVEVRTLRRHQELRAKEIDISPEEVRQNLLERDRIDSTRDDSPLRQAPDAVLIDNSFLTPAEQTALALQLAEEAILRQNRG
jgi:cytidylate kinase